MKQYMWFGFRAVLLFAAIPVLPLYVLVLRLSHSPRPAKGYELRYSSIASSGLLPDIEIDDASVALSLVVPCYNEQERLPLLLRDAVPYLRSNFGDSWEILIVDDGSKDQTRQVAFILAKELDMGENFRYCNLVVNRGKGGAVTHGMKSARGELILFADADNASDINGLSPLIEAVRRSQDKRAIAIGSRAHLVNTQQVIKRSFLRNILMKGFHLMVYCAGIRTIKDTQCGFKLFTRPAAANVFPYMHTEGWIFDVESLLIAIRKGIPVYEIPISWHEVTGSKVAIARDSLKMGIDLFIIRFAYLFGIYKDSTQSDMGRKRR